MQFLKMQELLPPPPPASLGDQDSNSGFGARDVSPDSVIFTADSNFSLFSSTSASVDRCSFASDIHDQEDSVVSDVSHSLAGHEFREGSASGGGCGGGPSADPDPNKFTVHRKNSNNLSSRIEKAKAQDVEEHCEDETEDETSILGSARNSFSRALKECQDRRLRSEVVVKKSDRRRPASLDLNNSLVNVVSSSSPRLGVMKKTSGAARRAGTFPSPGTPNYRHTSVGVQKGWSSERVPLHNTVNKRHVNTALLPYNNGRALPSKWEDAERWIFSPVSGDGTGRNSVQQPQRRPKSKSGPLGPPGIAYHSLYSPAAVTMLQGGNGENQIANSPFSSGVIVADALAIRCGGYVSGANFPASFEPCMARSISVHGCSELICQSSLATHQGLDEKLEGLQCSGSDVSRAVSRRDMATQMSPEGSPHSSSRQGSSFSPSTPILPIVELQSVVQSSKPEIRDVQVDEHVTMTRWSKKHRVRVPGRGSGNADDWKRKAVEIRSAGWDVSDTAKTMAKIKRDEAKITAWENLQKAKAEAAIRKLEMKLEKKRSSSMEKIMNKLRSAQKKAQEMRSSMAVNQAHQVGRTNEKAISFRRTRQISSFSGCFTCHAF